MTRDELEWRSESTYWLSRSILYRGMGFVYLCAFLVSAQQNKALIGDFGLVPVRENVGVRPTPAFSLCGFGDVQLDVVAWLGVLASVLMMFATISSFVLPLCCWLLYLSIVNLQSDFIMGYGWEWQVLETGFLITFLYPVYSATLFPKDYPPPFIVIVLCRWLAFRVMLGTGLSKMGTNASLCWRELTCTTTHYETQPIPNAIAWIMHHLPLPVHKLECAICLFVELLAPFLMLVPLRNIRIIGGLLPIFLMAMIILTGSYAYINWITLVPFAACFDDAFLRKWCFPAAPAAEAQRADVDWAENSPMKPTEPWPYVGGYADLIARYDPAGPQSGRGGIRNPSIFAQRLLMMIASSILAVVIAVKSQAPLNEMYGPSPWLQFYDDYFLVNAYGVFGFINKERIGIALEYTHDGRSWKTLDFPAVPGSVDRMPAYITPYHYRADWQVWIETTASMESNPVEMWQWQGIPKFMKVLFAKVLAGDTQAAALLAESPNEIFKQGLPPSKIKATPYLYTFSKNLTSLMHGTWWDRQTLLGYDGESMKSIVVDAVWSGPVSHLPPMRDWVLLYSTFAFAALLISLMRPRADRNENILFAACCIWLAGAGLLSFTMPVWKSSWLAGFLVVLAVMQQVSRAEEPAAQFDMGSIKKPSNSVMSIWVCLGLVFHGFALELGGCFLACVVILAVALFLQVALIAHACMKQKEASFDGILLGSAAFTFQAFLCAICTATFVPPGKLQM